MSAEKTRIAISVNDKIKHAAKLKGGDMNQAMQFISARYIYERLLARINKSTFADRYAVKGGVLMLALPSAGERMTMDTDFSVTKGPRLSVGACLREICAMESDPEDGLTFALSEDGKDALRIIREETDEPTVRGKLTATLCMPKPNDRSFIVDVTGAELPYEPQLVEWTPTLRGFDPFKVNAYPWELVMAEKLHAIMTGTMGNPRLRDYMDVIAMDNSGLLDYATTNEWIDRVFEKRGQPGDQYRDAIGLSEAFAAARQSDWAGTLRRTGYQSGIPTTLKDAIERVIGIKDQILSQTNSLALKV